MMDGLGYLIYVSLITSTIWTLHAVYPYVCARLKNLSKYGPDICFMNRKYFNAIS